MVDARGGTGTEPARSGRRQPAPGRPGAGPVTGGPDLLGLLARVSCHVYTGEVSPSGDYREVFTGPGIEKLLGGAFPAGADMTDAWHEAVHPEDWEAYNALGVSIGADETVSAEYRLVGLDGVTRWVLDQMWLREIRADGTRLVDGVITDVSPRKDMEQQLRQLAHSDPLTGLANRVLLGERIDQAMARAQTRHSGMALLLLDLDGFKAVNDTFGHAMGDELLVAVAGRLTACLRGQDVAARLGGDEFAILLETVDDTEAVHVAERVLTALAEPFALRRAQVVITASIGIARAEHGRTTHDLLRDADVAMYMAKAEGKNRLIVFHPHMQERVATRLQLETELREAVAERQFEVHYQPLINLDTSEVIGVEALLRWRHPTKGLLLPGEFVSVAEDTGLIVSLGRWVLHEACAQAAQWQLSDPSRILSVAVNLSPRQLHDPQLLETVASALARSGLPAAALTVEITENLLLADSTFAAARLGELRRIGVRIALDDFGTGYSSLAYLRQLPIDILKIDRSFVAPLTDGPRPAALVRSILDLALALDLDTVAEGVESDEQARILGGLGCRVAQGYAFARPQSAEETGRVIAAARQPERS